MTQDHPSGPNSSEPKQGPGRDLPRTEAELRDLVGEIVHERLADAQATARKAQQPPNRMLRAVLVVIFLGSSGYLLATSGAFRGPPQVPSSILGTWVTDDSAYAGRSFEVTPSALVLRLPDTPPKICPIIDLRHTMDAGNDVYTLEYAEDHAPMELTFVFRPGAKAGEIEFRHQPSLHWHRQE
jgi:hypothetical protein